MQRGVACWVSLILTISCAAGAAKKPGPIRIGVVAIQDRRSHGLGYSALDGKLLGLMRGGGFEVAPLRFQPAADVEHAARAANCAYILYTDVIDVHRTAGSQVTGAVKGVGGTLVGTQRKGRDIWEAEIEFRVFAIDQVLPLLSTSVTGRNGKSHPNPSAAPPAAPQAPAAAIPAAEPNILTDATPVEETGRMRKHKSVAVASALEREAKLVRERLTHPPSSPESE